MVIVSIIMNLVHRYNMPFFSSIKSTHSSIKVQLLRSADGKPTTAYRVYVEEV